MRALLAAIWLTAVPAHAQVGDEDGRYRSITYYPGGLFHISTSTDTQQTILLMSDEQIRSVVVSNPAAFQVNVTGGTSLTVHATTPTSLAVMNITTNQREYALELAPGGSGSAGLPLIVRFNIGEARNSATMASTFTPPAVLLAQVTYRIKGSKLLRPSSIGDDGRKTYITWGDDQPIPAVFTRGPNGSEEMVDGYFREGRFTIDRIYSRLIFKIDRVETVAERTLTPQGKAK